MGAVSGSGLVGGLWLIKVVRKRAAGAAIDPRGPSEHDQSINRPSVSTYTMQVRTDSLPGGAAAPSFPCESQGWVHHEACTVS